MTTLDFYACTIAYRDAQRDVLMPHGLPIWYEQGDGLNRGAEIDRGANSLRLWISKATIPDGQGGYKGRAQLQLAPGGITSAYGRWQMMLPESWREYGTYPKANRWMCVQTLSMGDRTKDGAFQISVDVAKDANDPTLRWYVTGEAKRGGKWQIVWERRGPAVPIGQWLDIECGYCKGGAGKGRFLLRANGVSVVDKTDYTYSPSYWASWLAPGLTAWQPAKLYLPGALIDHMTERNAVPAIYWRDMQIEEKWL